MALISSHLDAPADSDQEADNGSMLEVTCPPGAKPGDVLSLEIDGEEVEVEVPEGVASGETFEIQLAAPSPTKRAGGESEEDFSDEEGGAASEEDFSDEDEDGAVAAAGSDVAAAEEADGADPSPFGRQPTPFDRQPPPCHRQGAPGGTTLEVTCPPGAKPGDVLSLEIDGEEVEVEVPEGVASGETFEIQLAAPSPTKRAGGGGTDSDADEDLSDEEGASRVDQYDAIANGHPTRLEGDDFSDEEAEAATLKFLETACVKMHRPRARWGNHFQ